MKRTLKQVMSKDSQRLAQEKCPDIKMAWDSRKV